MTDTCFACPFRGRQLSTGLQFVPAEQRAYWNGHDLGLTVGEFTVLSLLVSDGRWKTYREIYDRIQSPGFLAGNGVNGVEANVRSSIKRLRNKFRAIDPEFAKITNYPRFGYRWEPSGVFLDSHVAAVAEVPHLAAPAREVETGALVEEPHEVVR